MVPVDIILTYANLVEIKMGIHLQVYHAHVIWLCEMVTEGLRAIPLLYEVKVAVMGKLVLPWQPDRAVYGIAENLTPLYLQRKGLRTQQNSQSFKFLVELCFDLRYN